MWYIVMFRYGDNGESLIEWRGPVEVTSPEEAVGELQTTPWDDVAVYTLAEEPDGEPMCYRHEDLSIEPPQAKETMGDW